MKQILTSQESYDVSCLWKLLEVEFKKTWIQMFTNQTRVHFPFLPVLPPQFQMESLKSKCLAAAILLVAMAALTEAITPKVIQGVVEAERKMTLGGVPGNASKECVEAIEILLLPTSTQLKEYGTCISLYFFVGVELYGCPIIITVQMFIERILNWFSFNLK